jgi:exoribonuclease R
LPERRVVLDEKGRILSVAPRERLDAHKLVEDFMIAANVARPRRWSRARCRRCTACTTAEPREAGAL